ncbi:MULTISPECIES: TraX family protein [unclassified Fusibacter]|uniref:TraX family protein n=1 Tax=unclassified Fusibacter TaxID=2624464 RepID=UPI0010123BF4|nr:MULTISPECIES: TraX family protein [unclassified Fusibacter]MCK8060361.1 conjugal transfer protein TraX [Fusibacter sp. A2]NPE20350.1 hypothetical protein [Fusibacter sp. A1]RXV63556.1 hypothetical protein DWB64_00860 [Fusibacter sp. A1]
MSNSTLKLIAILSMLLDHIGAVLFPEVMLFRIVGRIAFPIFCFLIIEGYYHTGDLKKYMVRLGVFALIAEVPFDLAFEGRILELGYQNIFFTLTLGLVGIYLYDKKAKSKAGGMLIMIIMMVLASMLRTDYGAYGIAFIFIMFMTRNDFKKMFQILGVISLLMVLLPLVMTFKFNLWQYLQAFQLLALGFIYFYNGKKGMNLKYAFYTFYPAHLLLLYLIKG